MKELLAYMVQHLVEHPDQVSITETQGEETLLELRVAQEDMGKVIGRQGRIARDLRTVLKAAAQRRGEKVTMDIVD